MERISPLSKNQFLKPNCHTLLAVQLSEPDLKSENTYTYGTTDERSMTVADVQTWYGNVFQILSKAKAPFPNLTTMVYGDETEYPCPEGLTSALSFLAMSMLRVVAKDAPAISLHIANTGKQRILNFWRDYQGKNAEKESES